MDAITFSGVPATGESALFELYSSVRSDELGMQNWDPALRSQILRFQFEAQQRGYRGQFPSAEWRLILRDGAAVGWFVVDRSGAALNLVDIAIVPDERNRGVGTSVIKALQDEAGKSDRPFVLNVFRTNVRAMALYARLGFRVIGETEMHRSMEWRGDPPSSTR